MGVGEVERSEVEGSPDAVHNALATVTNQILATAAATHEYGESMGSYSGPSPQAVHQPNGRGNNGPLTLIRKILIDDTLPAARRKPCQEASAPMPHKRGNRENSVPAAEMRPPARAPFIDSPRQHACANAFAPWAIYTE